jgi:hypothetical protein
MESESEIRKSEGDTTGNCGTIKELSAGQGALKSDMCGSKV